MIIEKLLSLQKTKAAKIVLYAYKYNGINQVKDMKKMMVLAVGATLLLSSCSSYTGAGAYTGAQFGSILGSAIGGISGGPRGSDIGTIVGMAGLAANHCCRPQTLPCTFRLAISYRRHRHL